MRMNMFTFQDVKDISEQGTSGSAPPAQPAGAQPEKGAKTPAASNTVPAKDSKEKQSGNKYTAQDCKDFWAVIKDWDPETVQWYILDLGQKDSNGKSKYNNIIQELIVPFYIGPSS